MLSQDDLARYQRQLKIPYIGEEGQEKLKSACVVIAGVGGLGCPLATYLTAAGIGHIILVDNGLIELSNLNRQILYWNEEIGEKKVEVAKRKLNKFNPSVEIIPVFAEINASNIQGIIKDAHAVIDGLDNLATRLVVNAACVAQKTPFIHGGVSRLRGRVTTILPGKTPCLACFNPEGRGGLGVLGVTPAVIANLQAIEAIKLILGRVPSLAGKLLLFNGDDMEFRLYDIARNPRCPVCSQISSELT